jgi:hypothetical protein
VWGRENRTHHLFAERAITRSINVRVRFGGEGDTSFRHMGFGKGATIVAT